jgi:hypothetical protein
MAPPIIAPTERSERPELTGPARFLGTGVGIGPGPCPSERLVQVINAIHDEGEAPTRVLLYTAIEQVRARLVENMARFSK